MDLKILSVHGHGDHKEEYVLLEAIEDCDVGRFQLCDTTFTRDGKVSNKLRHTYWFPDKEVKKGDLISVWTKTGSDTTTKNKKGTPVHRFYWGLTKAVWNDDGDCAVLQYIGAWKAVSVKS
ncbi:hypothetical protein [Pseudomonas sp. Gutcm_11s]|uniref:hypothetical protein n=1 Tax=Pseudomonas sp. Gutcm_11s TaxID=3026088 RepID=UPI0023620D27|nr:hypothetical protein [Pseudomonas sp. Gutcm_11s]MDD0841485.1 hypothetical protein [Pseudomonas sp. Gutcm_11s]